MTPSPPSITPEQVRWYRMQRSGLVEPFATPEAVASASQTSLLLRWQGW